MNRSEKILLVDDEPLVLDAYYRGLRKKFQIETALSGADGLEVLSEKGPFAVVVSDMRMPEMDGVKFLTRVKKRYPHSIRIMLTGNADQQTAVSAINEGDVFRFLNKPCTVDEMSDAIEAAIEQHHCQTIEHNLLLDATQKLDYLSEDQDDNPAVQAINDLSGKVGKLAAVLAKSAKDDKEFIDHCRMAGMMSCIGDLVMATRFNGSSARPAPSVDPSQLGGYMLGSWGLPKAVVEGIRTHRKAIEKPQGTMSVTAVLHAAWYFLQDQETQSEVAKNKDTLAYLSGFAGEDLARKWMIESEIFVAKEAANA